MIFFVSKAERREKNYYAGGYPSPDQLIQMQANSQSHHVAAVVVDRKGFLLLPTQCLHLLDTKTFRQIEVKRLRRDGKEPREQKKK